ncbi:MAG TPA: hypothetical protein VJT84_06840, partial [Gaiellaceae bacterium]|nr:hypothetical protein [Gaiellaceae bacterium]
MERLTGRHAAAAAALVLGAAAAAAAVLLPGLLQSKERTLPRVRYDVVPRTHLFGQPITATLDVPHGSVVVAGFLPYQVLTRSVTRSGATDHYAFVLDCLRTRCLGEAGGERELWLPPARVKEPGGRTTSIVWPPLQEASRLPATAVTGPRARNEFAAAAPSQAHGRLEGRLLAAGAA